ncbi:vitronectin b isoform X1 [Paramormyrops kingsleyae]|uniref:vitronectin b isoform X1 n=1 Tax=Paramormyrops kingsleyae TaxID=1676925 RepID=UPI003B9756BC
MLMFAWTGGMKPALIFLTAVLAVVQAAEESCVGRCDKGFDATIKCQCDSLCKFYSSCCTDYEETCRGKSRGDTFAGPDEESDEQNVTVTEEPAITPPGEPDPDAATCSGRPFDAFMQLKNGSIYAFRGEYFFELDDKAVMPGYPKLIKDVWGIEGPINAAFTRINCQGKTYIFKGNKYWRFDGDVLDEDYPRDISVGFSNIPDDVDAAFAVPSPGYRRKEKVYFFKGDQYYQYEFKNQPSHKECAEMTKAAPSVLFTNFADQYCDKWEELLSMLFQGFQGHQLGPRPINQDWVGIQSPVDAVMMGRFYLSAAPTQELSATSVEAPTLAKGRFTRSSRRGRKKGKKGRRQRLPVQDYDYFDYRYGMWDTDDLEVEQTRQPVQNVYFFKEDKYYRVNLHTKRVDYANPRYPRSIAKYWLGCKENSQAEKK